MITSIRPHSAHCQAEEPSGEASGVGTTSKPPKLDHPRPFTPFRATLQLHLIE